MNISLPAEQESYIRGKVQAGAYASESDVICDALRLMVAQDTKRPDKLEALRQAIQEGVASLNRGEGKPLDMEAVKARGRALLQDRTGPFTPTRMA